MSCKKYCSPLTVTLTKNLKLKSVYSIHGATGLDISGCEFADLINFETILLAPPHPDHEHIGIVKNSNFLNIARHTVNDEDLGVLLLYVHANRLLIIIDDERELILEVLDH